MAKESKLNQIPLPALIAGVVVLLLIVGWQVFRSVGPDPAIEKGMDDNRFITQMAIKSGGDINRLSPEEREKLQELTKGDGEVILRMHPSAAMGRMQQGGAAPANPFGGPAGGGAAPAPGG